MAREGQPHPDELKALERELRALVPRGPRVELARMMYLAGQASMSPVPPTAPSASPILMGWLWPLSTGAMTLVALWLGVMVLAMRAPTGFVNGSRHVDPPSHHVNAPQEPVAPAPVVAQQPSRVADPTYGHVSKGTMADDAAGARKGIADSPGTYGSLTERLMNEHRRSTQRATMWSELFNQ